MNKRRDSAPLIWLLFTQKIEQEWEEKYKHYGNNFKEVRLSTNFAQAVHSDMLKFFDLKNISTEIPHFLSIYRYFQQGGFSKNVQANTLDTFCRYLGYQDWENFLEQNSQEAPESLKTKVAPPLAPTGKKSVFQQYLPWAIIIALLMVHIAYFLSLREPSQKSKAPVKAKEAKEIIQLIQEANQATMDAYKSLPNCEKEKEKLSQYFWTDKSAYQNIVRVLNNNKARKWVLNNPNNPSNFHILSMEVNQLEQESATVYTEEYWLILWYDTQSQQDVYRYEITNEQSYTLKKDKSSNFWKIVSNEYEARLNKIFPQIFSKDSFDLNISIEDLKKEVTELIRQGNTVIALSYVSYYAAEKNLPEQTEFILLESRYNEIVRATNLDKMLYADYLEKKAKIEKELMELMKGL